MLLLVHCVYIFDNEQKTSGFLTAEIAVPQRWILKKQPACKCKERHPALASWLTQDMFIFNERQENHNSQLAMKRAGKKGLTL